MPYPPGYEAAKCFIRNVHFKDARRYPDGSWAVLADGDVDWGGQIAALKADGYKGAIAIEPHLAPSVAATRHALRRLRAHIAAAEGTASDALAGWSTSSLAGGRDFQPDS